MGMDRTDVNSVEYVMSSASEKPRLLLHACCGPCSAGVLDRIHPYFDTTIFFYNPNILPKEEFILRLEALKTVVSHFDGVKLIVPEQSAEEFVSRAAGMRALPEGGARCTLCFDIRLSKTAEYLSEHADEYDFFATTLTVSPHKNAPLINSVGAEAAARFGVRYLASDFKKHDGYLRSVQLSKQFGIYRQRYCGCGFGS